MKKMIRRRPVGFGYGRIGMAKSRSYEDRHFFGTIKTKSELRLTVGMVADGVGGGNFGERAAQITVDVIRGALAQSMETDLIPMMGKAIGAANRAVFAEAQEEEGKKGMSSTLVLAVIHEGRLYVANVGDSRIYLLRDGDLRQITVDHTWANEKIRSGVLDEATAMAHFNADAITRSIGFEKDVAIDFGLYLQGGTENQKKAIAQQGVALKDDDVVLLCSDGLIKHSPMGLKMRYVNDAAMQGILMSEHAEAAAKTLVDTAVGKNVDDNTTAVVMEMPGRTIKFLDERRRWLPWLGGVVALGLAFLITLMLLGNVRDDLRLMEANGTATQAAGLMLTEEANVFTPTPTATVVLKKTTDIGTIVGGDGASETLHDRQLVRADGFVNVFLNGDDADLGSEIFLRSGSQLLFETVPVRTVEFVLWEGSQALVNAGAHLGGARVFLNEGEGAAYFDVKQEGLLLVDAGFGEARAICLRGDCTATDGNGTTIELGEDVWTVLGMDDGDVSTVAMEEGLLDWWRFSVDTNSMTALVLDALTID